MNLENNISVIIPVYNASRFIAKAVESALIQPEVGEILLIEDNSSDNSLAVCQLLANKYDKVKLLVHKNNENRGAGESRNLGIKNAKSDFIAFLDADDYYLADRFRMETNIFSQNPEVDGVYGALGFHYYSDVGKKKYTKNGYTEEISTFSERIAPHELVFAIMHIHNSAKGQLTINTLTLKKEVFDNKAIYFNTLKLHEDTAFFIQLSINCILVTGEIMAPIGMRGVHDNNRIVAIPANCNNRFLYWKFLYNWSKSSLNGRKFSKLFQANLMKERLLLSNKYIGLFQLLWYCMSNSIFLRKDIFFAPAAKHVLGKNTGPYILNYKQRIQINLFKDHPYSSIMDEFFTKRK